MTQEISTEELLRYNNRGLFPGPGESQDVFVQRVAQSVSGPQGREAPLQGLEKGGEGRFFEPIEKELLQPAWEKAYRDYGCTPDWVPVVVSNQGLAPWQGASTWIIEEPGAPVRSFIQVRKAFQKKQKMLGLYGRTELLTHELAHAARGAFEEPLFEEVLAYRCASSGFRRYFGPLLRSGKELAFFLLSLCFCLLFSILAVLQPSAYWDQVYLSSLLFPFSLAFYGLGRLVWVQNCFGRALRKLEKYLGDARKASALVYRLTDEEIRTLATLAEEELGAYLSKKRKGSLRWRMIQEVYGNG